MRRTRCYEKDSVIEEILPFLFEFFLKVAVLNKPTSDRWKVELLNAFPSRTRPGSTNNVGPTTKSPYMDEWLPFITIKLIWKP